MIDAALAGRVVQASRDRRLQAAQIQTDRNEDWNGRPNTKLVKKKKVLGRVY